MALNFLRGEFRRERESGFSLLKRIPSTDVRKFIDYFSSLNEQDKETLSEAMVHRALCDFSPPAPNPYETGNVALEQYRNAMCLMGEIEYWSVREQRLALAVAKAEPQSRFGRFMTDEIRQKIAAIKPVKSAEIRKVVKLALSHLFVPMEITHSGEQWHYEGVCNGNNICVTAIYAARYHQFEYEISVQNKKRRITLGRLNYERIMGLAAAWWDCLEQSNLDQSIALFRDFVVYCADIPDRLPNGCKP